MRGDIDGRVWEGNIGSRAYNGLKAAGFNNLNALAVYIAAYTKPNELKRILSPLMPKNQMGKRSYVEVAKALKEHYEGGGEGGDAGSVGPDGVVEGGTAEAAGAGEGTAEGQEAQKVD